MRKIITICMCLSTIIVNAQKQSFDFLKNEKEINFVIDYSNVVIGSYSEKEFVEYQCIRGGEKWKTKWDSIIKKELYRKFTGYFNENFIGYSDLRGGNFPNANYQATIKLITIDIYGNTVAKVILTKINSSDIIDTIDIYGKGGKAGSRENLMGDGFKRAGSDFGKKVAKKLGIKD